VPAPWRIETMSEVYTRSQIKAGIGLFTSGEWTCVWQVGRDQYVTTDKSSRPRNPDAVLVAGGRRHQSQRGPKVGSLFELTWC